MVGSLDETKVETLSEAGALDEFLGDEPDIPPALMPLWEAFWHLRLALPVEFPIDIPGVEAYTRGIGCPWIFLTWLPFIQAMDSEFRLAWTEQVKLQNKSGK